MTWIIIHGIILAERKAYKVQSGVHSWYLCWETTLLPAAAYILAMLSPTFHSAKAAGQHYVHNKTNIF